VYNISGYLKPDRLLVLIDTLLMYFGSILVDVAIFKRHHGHVCQFFLLKKSHTHKHKKLQTCS